jgi:DNA-binding SARP family transcriptional activator
MKSRTRISLLGRLTIRLGDETRLTHVPHKAQELLAYLILHRDKPHPRDTLAELLWGDRDSPNSRKYLRQALWQLHTGLLSMGRSRAAQILRADCEWIELSLDDTFELDIMDLERGFDLACRVRPEELRPELARELAGTVQLYRGDLLEGCSLEWCTYDRERFRRMFLAILDRLTDHYEARHDYDAAIAYASLALRYDRARERSHRSAMRALAKAGDRSEAIRQFERCASAAPGDPAERGDWRQTGARRRTCGCPSDAARLERGRAGARRVEGSGESHGIPRRLTRPSPRADSVGVPQVEFVFDDSGIGGSRHSNPKGRP